MRIRDIEILCPLCHAPLDERADAAQCSRCMVMYPRSKGVLACLQESEQMRIRQETESHHENRVKNFFKTWPRLYACLTWLFAPVWYTGLTAKAFLHRAPADARMLNLGSGPTQLHPRAYNVDLYPFPNVDVIADAQHLPFADNTFDIACTDQVLEHVPRPEIVAKELLRVTRPGGHIYTALPFLFPLHPSPKDYSRLSVDGICELFEGTEVVESGILLGPMSAFLSFLAAWASLVCSFGNAMLRSCFQYIFSLMLAPFRFIDIVLARIPGAETISMGMYVVVRKLDQPRS